MPTMHKIFLTLAVLIIPWVFNLASAQSSIKVNDIEIPFISEGKGAVVVFVHGAFSDNRVWHPQRQEIAAHYRFVAPTLRYFGSLPWADDGRKYSQNTHVQDLVAFIRKLNVGPVYLVGRSYGGTLALRTALDYPQLVKGVVAQEPTIAAGAVKRIENKAILKQERKGLKSAKQAAMKGNYNEATRLFADWTNNDPGGFDNLDDDLRKVHLENGRTIPLHFNSVPRNSKASCDELSGISIPVTITSGELTRPFFDILAKTAQQCIPGADLKKIPAARHAATSQNPGAFNSVLIDFLKQYQ